MKKRVIQAAAWLLFTGMTAFCADIDVKVSPQPLMAGEAAQLELVSPEGQPEIKELPEVEGIQWRRGVSTSSRISIDNFKKTTTYSSMYSFVALKEGDISIPALKVQVGKKKILTDPVKLKVHASKFAAGEKEVKGDGSKLEDVLFVRSAPLTDKKHVFTGEEIPFEIRVYSIGGLNVNYAWPEFSMENVVFRDFSAVNRENSRFAPYTVSSENIGGRNFNVFSFRTAFRPISSGQISGKFTVRCVIRIPDDRRRDKQRDFFSRDPLEDFFSDDFFGPSSRYKEISHMLAGETGAIEVKPLPEMKGDSAFLGLVGRWDLNAELKVEKLKKGEPVTLKISAVGDGTADTLKAPDLQIPGFRVYPPEVRKGVTGASQASIDISYVLIPLKEGEADMNFSVSYFSTSDGKYVESRISRKFAVEAGESVSSPVVAEAAPVALADGAGKKSVRQELLYLKKSFSGPVLIPLWKNKIIWILVFTLAGPLALGISELLHSRRMKLMNNPLLRRKIAAEARRGRILREIRNAGPDGISIVVRNEVVPFLNDLLGLPPGTSGVELAGRIEDETLADCLRKTTDSSYMPGAPKSERPDSKEDFLKALKRFSAMFMLLLLPLSAFSADGVRPREGIGFNPYSAYDGGNFAAAAEYFRRRINDSSPDPAMLYNLGNCHYQQGELAQALVCFEKARLVAPRDSDIRENLNLVRRNLMLAETGKMESPKDVLVNLRDILRPDEWLSLAALMFSAACLILAARRKINSSTMTASAVSAAVLVMILCCAAALSQSRGAYGTNTALAVQKSIPLYFLPSENSRQSDFRLNEGDAVAILDERQDWIRVRAANADGWVQKGAVAKLWP